MTMRFKTGRPSLPTTAADRVAKARLALAGLAPAVQGQGGNGQTMRACGLLLRHGLGVDEAWPLLCEWNQRCEPPWDEASDGGPDSLRRLLENTARREGKDRGEGASRPAAPSSPTIKARAPAVDFAKVAESFAAGVTGNVALWAALSPVKVAPDDFNSVSKLFAPGEGISIVTDAKLDGEKWRPSGAGYVLSSEYVASKERQKVIRCFNGKAGAWVRINPVKTESRGASDADVTAFRHVLLESDKLPRLLQLRVLKRLLDLGLPIALVVDSGGSSFHAWVRVDCPDAESYRAMAARLLALPLGFDPANKNPARLSRFPNAQRGDQSQACLYLNPNAKPLTEAVMQGIESVLSAEVAKLVPVAEPPAQESAVPVEAGEVVAASPSREPTTKKADGEGFDFTALDARRIRLEDPPPEPVPVFKLAGQTISTAGNLTVIAAQAKSGKSATVGGMVASVLCAGDEERDCLGFSAASPDGRAVILFDTEQSRRDSWALLRRAVDRAGVDGLPDNVRPYGLLDVPTKERRAMLGAELERASAECGGVHVVLVDGVADLCIDPNDAEEAFGLVDELVQLAVRHECPLVVVLHENPAQAGQAGKTRGHLGSQLERKAESNLRLEKDDAGVSVIYSTRCRNGDIPKSRGVAFEWSDEKKMHVITERVVKGRRDAKREEQSKIVDEIYVGVVGGLPYSDLREKIESAAAVSTRTAERRVKEWIALGLLSCTGSPPSYFRPATVNRQ